MKFKNIFRTHSVAIGFAAVSLLAGAARAQEIDNTVWPDSASVEPFPQPARVIVANEANSIPAHPGQTESASAIDQPVVSQATILSGGPEKEGWVIGASILLMSPAAVLVLSKIRRAKHSVNVRAYHDKRSTALY